MLGAFFVFAVASVGAPEYVGVGDPWRWIFYVLGGLSWLLAGLGFVVAVGRAYGGSQGYWLSFYLFLLFTMEIGLHLATAHVPMADWLLTALRVFMYVIVLPLSLLALLGMLRVVEGLSTAENRTDAILAALAILGALLPILVNLLGNA